MKLKLRKYYQLLARPVVIVTTISKRGEVNAAPFSFNTPVSLDPPLYAISCRPEHDTWANIKETKEFVVNVCGYELGEFMHILEQDFPRGVNELEKAGLKEVPSVTVKPPRVESALGWIECKLHSSYEIGDHILIVGEVLWVEVKDSVWKEVIDSEKILLHIGKEYFAKSAKLVKYKRYR